MLAKRKAEENLEGDREEKKVALEPVEHEQLQTEDAEHAEAAEAPVEEDHDGDAGKQEEDEEEGEDTKTPDDPTLDEDDKEEGEAESSNDPSSAPADSSSAAPVPTPASVQNDWQAIYAAPYNAYYFYNVKTGETTWVNPLDPSAAAHVEAPSGHATVPAAHVHPSASPSSSTPAPTSTSSAANALNNPWAAPVQHSDSPGEGIDPLLYHLDSTLSSPALTSSHPGQYTSQARFNAHTGRFESDPTRRPEKMGEWERWRRMGQVYFDVNSWEKEVEERKEREEREGKEKKKPTKKDLERFAEAKKRKKLAKTAWLRN
ncbi:hypothetical protein DACRYDRAFT_107941 [Dacryopinax primogenitus]|uniref:WW domain-containing protein n=1 Tax=Dacryopinax primogenitus (strain DJM 731) TaxID=1858805 RepID=M5FXY8_DACPD|nr:uncharacterized protein DACRYDRAFT_107941 [Dacryopinax primogenitus]EJU01389.1 hypothetical protein DACRYDRAFT_107941 [Dacryopinax primogenitus]